MTDPTIETNEAQTESNEVTETKPRARLTVEVPTEITAGARKNCVSCYCSRTYCCS